jgi:uncharacterized protein YcgI (DUF1989 family)
MRKVHEQILAPKSGLALLVKKGQHLRLIDLEGKQVVDMAVFNADNCKEKLSTSYSRSRQVPQRAGVYAAKDHVTEGDVLLSTACRPMMTLVKETQPIKGMHDTHHRTCNRRLYELLGLEPRDGCQETLARELAPFGISYEEIPDTFDIHMHFRHDVAARQWVIEEPCSRPGDYVEFRAEMDCLVGLSNCPEDTVTACNAGHCTPYRVEIYEP